MVESAIGDVRRRVEESRERAERAKEDESQEVQVDAGTEDAHTPVTNAKGIVDAPAAETAEDSAGLGAPTVPLSAVEDISSSSQTEVVVVSASQDVPINSLSESSSSVPGASPTSPASGAVTDGDLGLSAIPDPQPADANESRMEERPSTTSDDAHELLADAEPKPSAPQADPAEDAQSSPAPTTDAAPTAPSTHNNASASGAPSAQSSPAPAFLSTLPSESPSRVSLPSSPSVRSHRSYVEDVDDEDEVEVIQHEDAKEKDAEWEEVEA